MSTSPVQIARRPRLAIAVLCLGGLTAALVQTLVIPIQSELPELLHTSASNAAWVVTVTLLTAAVVMPVAGRVADLVGKQRVIAVSAMILLVGSVICALSDSIVPMLAGRALQGLAMGFIPVGISLIREIAPPEIAGTSLAAMSATLGVGGAIGLPFAAWITDVGDWHALFWVAGGAALLILILVMTIVPHIHDGSSGRLDVTGAIGLAIGLVAFLVGISKGNEWGWSDPETLIFIIGGLVVLLLWGVFELRQDEPLVDLRTTARMPVLMTNLAAVAVGFGMMAQSIAVPQLLQLPESTGYGLGQSILAAGLWMAPGGLMMLIFAPVSGGLIARFGARITLMTGAAVIGVGYLVAVFLMDAPWQLLVATCVASAGVGIGYAAMPTLILDSVDAREAGSAVGLNSLMRSMGTTFAAAVMAAILTSNTTLMGSLNIPTKGAFQVCFIVGAVATFVGVAIAWGIPRRANFKTVDPVDPADLVATSA